MNRTRGSDHSRWLGGVRRGRQLHESREEQDSEALHEDLRKRVTWGS
jgi:hypothetical protein